MTLQLIGLNQWPGMLGAATNPGVTTNITLDAAGEYVAYVLEALENMVVSHVGHSTRTVLGSPTADVRIETVDSSGLPTGTLWDTDTNIVTGTLTSNSWHLHALTAAATIAAKDNFAVKILFNSGTSIIEGRSGPIRTTSNFPYQATNVTGSAVKSSISSRLIALGSSATAFYNLSQIGFNAVSAVSTGTFSNSVAGAQRGVRFKIPFAFRLRGLQWWNNNSIGDYKVHLYSDAGSLLATSATAYDGNFTGAGGSASTPGIFDSPYALVADTWYRAVIEPTSATVITLAVVTAPSTDYMISTYGGANYRYTTYTTAGGWVDATDQYPYLDLLGDQLDDGAGGGAGLRRRKSMSGGMSC